MTLHRSQQKSYDQRSFRGQIFQPPAAFARSQALSKQIVHHAANYQIGQHQHLGPLERAGLRGRSLGIHEHQEAEAATAELLVAQEQASILAARKQQMTQNSQRLRSKIGLTNKSPANLMNTSSFISNNKTQHLSSEGSSFHQEAHVLVKLKEHSHQFQPAPAELATSPSVARGNQASHAAPLKFASIEKSLVGASYSRDLSTESDTNAIFTPTRYALRG